MRKTIRVYLSGGMEYAENEGADWRSSVEDWVVRRLKHRVFNPVEQSEKHLNKVLPDIRYRELKSTNIEAYIGIVKHFVDLDSREIALRSDYVICNWDRSAQLGAGTKGELTMARYCRKPVYMVTQMPMNEIPGWVLGCVTRFFGSFEELKTYLLRKYASRIR